MFLLVALLFVVLGHLTLIALAVLGVGAVWGVALLATRPKPPVTAPAGPGPRRPARVEIPRQYGERDPLPERRRAS